jgi:hypothetical protein
MIRLFPEFVLTDWAMGRGLHANLTELSMTWHDGASEKGEDVYMDTIHLIKL